MTRKELIASVENTKAETKSALQGMYDAMNQGQQKGAHSSPAIRQVIARMSA